MSEIELFLRDMEEEKNKMIEELTMLNGRREQLRDDICHFNRAISGLKAILRKEGSNDGTDNT